MSDSPTEPTPRLKNTKRVVRAIVSLGTGRIVHSIIDNNIDHEEDKKIDKITVPVASYVVGGMVADAAGDHSDKIVDDIADTWDKVFGKKKTVTPES